MTDAQRAEELEYFYDLMIRCTASIEANLSKRDRETAQMWYRTSRCFMLLMEENKRLRTEIYTLRKELGIKK